ncbi:MAG: metallophosphoesterase [Anaerolineales bacterium]|nr:metallophosphoesterase [Anaerolineales bacterium]
MPFSHRRYTRRFFGFLLLFPLLFASIYFLSRGNAFSASNGGALAQYLPLVYKPGPHPTTFIPAGSVWKYLDNGSNQGTVWHDPGYDDSAWAQGPAQLGYGDGDEATVISYGPDPNDKYITTYFRHTFNITNPAEFTQLNYHLLRDDGAVIYLNGQEVVRSNMPAGEITFETLTVLTMNLVIENLYNDYQTDTTHLFPGTNLLAVELHQSAGFSSDVGFDLVMTGMTAGYEATTRFAAIGDYGQDTNGEGAVANLVTEWDPEYIITLGDNNYPAGALATLDENITAYYSEFIEPAFSATRFFPALGNHDWGEGGIQSITCTGSNCTGPYLDYFGLPGNERYYDYIKGPVHFFVLDSDPREPDGVTADSPQALWLQATLATSTAPWKVVYFHHPPYSSGLHGNNLAMQWPFKTWGADVVLSGHDHNYEHLIVDDFHYFVNGSGGATLRECLTLVPGSQLCYDTDYGAMIITADACNMTLTFVTPGTTVPTNNPYIDTVLLDNGVCP